ncbi:MAG: flagellar motor switch protein FliG [Candidatus Zixiibacteriota bacterium]
MRDSIDLTSLNGSQKAAILLVAIGKSAAAKIMKFLPPNEAEKISLHIAELNSIPRDTIQSVIEEYAHMVEAHEYVAKGGIDFAQDVLESSLGKVVAHQILERVKKIITVSGFNILREIDIKRLVNVVKNEHPQTIAIIMAHMTTKKAAELMNGLPQDLKVDVSYRLASIDRIPPNIVRQIETVLERELAVSLGYNKLAQLGGTKSMAQILNLVDRRTEDTVMSGLEEKSLKLSQEIRKLMFVFEDIIMLTDRSIQRVLREIDTKLLSVALKLASDELKEKLLSNLSERAGEMVKEEMEFSGPTRVSDVEAAQQEILQTIRRLEETGEIVVVRPGEEGEVIA